MALAPNPPTGRLTARNRGFLRRQQTQAAVPRRPLTAAAEAINLRDRVQARKMRVLRQGWQQDASGYVEALPELSFAYRFMAHASTRMRYFAAYVNPDEPDGPPIPANEVRDLPSDFVADMEEAIAALGIGRIGLSPIQEAMSWCFGVVGECYIVGSDDPQGGDTWKIRSIDELMIFDDVYKLREVPLDPQGQLGWTELDPATTYVARMWTPHWRFSKLANSPMRSLLDVAEELILLSRDVRAVARSRLAGGGILKIPEGLRMEALLEDDLDAMGESWFGRFAEAMMTPLADEGVASAVVPIGISGEPEALAQLDHLIVDRPYSALAMELRAEAIGRIATGLDVPREVLEGMSDPNHWGAWLVSDDTFRHHIEPQQIRQVDALSIGYYRPWLTAKGWQRELVNRACIWYDPVDLITKPDPMLNFVQMHDRMAVSDAALRKAGGATEEDAPQLLERYLRMISHMRSFPPNVLEAIIHAADPNLTIPPIQQSGQVPGMGPKGAVEPVAPTPPATAPASPSEDASASPNGTGPQPSSTAPPLPTAPPAALPQAAAEAPQSFATAPPARTGPSATHVRLSRRLADIDAQVRARLHTAACAAMLRTLDRAGAKLRTKARGSKAFKVTDGWALVQDPRITDRRLAAALGRPVVASLGLADSTVLLDANWDDLHRQFVGWVAAAQRQAVRVACQLAQLSPKDRRVTRTQARLADAIEPAWTELATVLDAIAERLLYNPAPDAPDEVLVDPNTIVPVGVIRQALTMAGGKPPTAITAAEGSPGGEGVDVQTPQDVPTDPEQAYVSVPIPDGGIGTGDGVGDMLQGADMQAESYEWVHGPTMHPFEPHEELDGVSFASFDDDVLANNEGFPENDFYFPGDHDGCFAAGTLVSGPAPVGATLRHWQGQMVEVRLASGEFLTATPNHPVLTSQGWVGLGELAEGDEVVRCLDGEGITRLVPNEYQVPTRIEEIADPFGPDGLARVPVAPENFHGDGTGSEVAVVWTDRNLRDGVDAALAQPGSQALLALADPMIRPSLPTERSATPSVEAIGPTPLGGVSGEGVSPVLLGAEGGAVEGAGLTDRPSLHTLAPQALGHGIPVDAEGTSETRQRLASLIAADKVVHVERHPFAGHVYNLDTRVGWYIAGAILVGNCSCDFNTIWAPAGEEGAPEETGAEAATAPEEDTGTGATGEGFQALLDALSGDTSPMSAKDAAADLADARASVMDDITATAQAARDNLESADMLQIARPATGLAGQVSRGTGGEYDWYVQLSDSERDRLRNNGWIAAGETVSKPDQAADLYAEYMTGGGKGSASVDQAMSWWVDQTRTADAGQLLASTGRLPTNMARFGDYNWQNLAPNSNYDIAKLFGPKDAAADYLAEVRSQAAADMAQSELTAKYGEPIWSMTYEEYAAEVTALEATDAVVISEDAEFGTVYDKATQDALSRLDELLPPSLVPESGDYSLRDVYDQAIQVAQIAGLPTGQA